MKLKDPRQLMAELENLDTGNGEAVTIEISALKSMIDKTEKRVRKETAAEIVAAIRCRVAPDVVADSKEWRLIEDALSRGIMDVLNRARGTPRVELLEKSLVN